MARLGRNALKQIAIAPGDIRTADATRAADIYSGYYVFGGRLVNGEGRPPFDIPPPTPEFARELAGFAWLRHMRAAGTSLARSNSRVIVGDFLAAEQRLRRGPAGEPAVAARRVLSWLSQAPFVLDGADEDFYHAFLRGLGREVAILARHAGEGAGQARLLAGIALAEVALCADMGPALLKRAATALGDETSRQIFADGGHVGRNPGTLIDLLLDFLPLRQTFGARGQPAPQAILNAIDRMIPMVRLLRHGDGSLALFNGMGVTEPDHVATVLAYADSRGRALLNAPHAGYQRLEGTNALAIVDAGAPPPTRDSGEAHAGCLSFEYSIGLDRVVVNCGAPPPGNPAAREAARQTAAHSTLVIDDTSSCRFATSTGMERALSGAIIAGPREVSAERRELAEATILELSHDGYVRGFGRRHFRRMALTRDGQRLAGEDRLAATPGRPLSVPTRFDIRFHLHPAVAVALDETGTACMLTVGRYAVTFEAGGALLRIEESVFFAAPTGAQRTKQIVVSGTPDDDARVTWSFTKLGEGPLD